MAAIIATQDAPAAVGPSTGDNVQWMIGQINALKAQISANEKERQTLLRELQRLAGNEHDVRALQDKLVEKDQQIQSLVRQVTVLQTGIAKSARPQREPPMPSQAALVIGALSMAHNSIDNCLDEWIERARKLETADGWRTPDVDLVVRLSVSPDGNAHSASSTMRTSADHLCSAQEPRCHESPSLRICIEAALTRVKFPQGAELLDLEVGIGWSQGLRNVSPRIVGRRTVPTGTIDLR
jgi:hypothetical protein